MTPRLNSDSFRPVRVAELVYQYNSSRDGLPISGNNGADTKVNHHRFVIRPGYNQIRVKDYALCSIQITLYDLERVLPGVCQLCAKANSHHGRLGHRADVPSGWWGRKHNNTEASFPLRMLFVYSKPKDAPGKGNNQEAANEPHRNRALEHTFPELDYARHSVERRSRQHSIHPSGHYSPEEHRECRDCWFFQFSPVHDGIIGPVESDGRPTGGRAQNLRAGMTFVVTSGGSWQTDTGRRRRISRAATTYCRCL